MLLPGPFRSRGDDLARLASVVPLGLGLAGVALLLPSIRRRPTLLALCLSLGASLCYFAYHLRPEGAATWVGVGDASKFHRMAQDWPWRPDGWWRYRILIPSLVRHLPMEDIGHGYALVGLITVTAAGPVLSLLLRDLGYGAAARLGGVVLYLFSFAPLYNSYNYALPDPAAMLVLLLAARAMALGRDVEFALWLLVGCVTKEVVLFLVPARWILGWMREGGRASTLRTMGVAAPAGLLFLWLRGSEDGGEGALGFITGPAFLFPWLHQPDNTARLFSPFGAGWALMAIGVHFKTPWTRAGVGFAIPCVLSLLVTDSGRMLIYLMPFAIPAALDGAGLLRGVTRPRWETVAALALAALSVRLWDPFVLLWKVPEPLRRGAALLLIPVVTWLALRSLRHRDTATPPPLDEERAAL
jgi:hypothetical protein